MSLAYDFDNTSPEFWNAYQTNLAIAGPQGILGLLANFSLDALILPTTFSPRLPALAGLPVVTVPLGFYPYNTTVSKNERKTLVQVGPNIPYVCSFHFLFDCPFALDILKAVTYIMVQGGFFLKNLSKRKQIDSLTLFDIFFFLKNPSCTGSDSVS